MIYFENGKNRLYTEMADNFFWKTFYSPYDTDIGELKVGIAEKHEKNTVALS